MIQQLMHYESVVGTLQDAKDRLVDREGCYQRKTFKPEGVTSRTKAHIDKELKDIVIENLTKKYGQVTIGIHGQELPKYTEGTKEWWMNNLGFKENPQNQSRIIMKETQKYWAKNDQMRLADVSADYKAAPLDHFKVEHVPQKYKFNITPNVQSITHWKPKEDEYVHEANQDKVHRKQIRWSDQEKMFRCEGDDRLIDKIFKHAEEYERAIQDSLEKREKHALNNPDRSPKSRVHGMKAVKTSSDYDSMSVITSPKIPQRGGKAPLSSAGDANQSPYQNKGGSTARGALTISLGNGVGTMSSSFQQIGKSTLFSRVALSPSATMNAEKGKGLNESKNNSEQETQATTSQYHPVTTTKIFRNSTYSTAFKESVQRGVLSGAGILKH